MGVVICFAIGYLCGSFLTADVVMRAQAGESAFSVGSGNPGMANVGARLGTGWAALVLAGDIGKTIAGVALGALACWGLGADGLLRPVVGAPWAAPLPFAGTGCALVSGLGAVVGHDFPFWHGFRGGKGVTATCTALMVFSMLLGALASVVGLAVVVATRRRRLDAGAWVIPAVFLAGSLAAGMPWSVVAWAAALLALSLATWARGRTAAGRTAP